MAKSIGTKEGKINTNPILFRMLSTSHQSLLENTLEIEQRIQPKC